MKNGPVKGRFYLLAGGTGGSGEPFEIKALGRLCHVPYPGCREIEDSNGLAGFQWSMQVLPLRS